MNVSSAPDDSLFLPDFCEIRNVFSIIIVGELLAFVLVLTPTRVVLDWWSELALSSLFIQWVALSSAASLCVSRRWLRRLGNVAAGLVGYAIVLVVTLVLSEAAYWLVESRLVDVGAPHFRLVEDIYVLVDMSALSPLRVTPWHLEFVLRNLGISAIVSAVALRYFYVQHQWRINIESEAQSRIQALQSRIRPHFLFNSMNTIASLARSDPELAEEVTEDLADLFRVSLGDARVTVRLEQELEVCRRYLRIEAQRLGERMRLTWDVDALPADAVLPALILQPLLENAVYHGIEPAPEGGCIEISGRHDAERMTIRIANPRPTAPGRRAAGNQMAQDNVRQRLGAFFGSRATLEVEEGPERYVVTLDLPYLTEAPAREIGA